MTAHTIQARRAELCRENSRRNFFAPLAEGESCELQIPSSQSPGESNANAAAQNREPALSPPGESSELPDSSVGSELDNTPQRETGNPPPPPELPDCDATLDETDADADAQSLLAEEQVQDFLRGKSPSKRNRDVFRAVVVEHRKQRDVAREFDITQPRVNQILKQVGAWLSRVVAERDAARDPQEQLQLAENVARMQYDHLYNLSLELLEESKRDTATKLEYRDKNGDVVWTRTDTRQNHAQAAFVHAARQAVNDRAKFEGIVGLPARRAATQCGMRSAECGMEKSPVPSPMPNVQENDADRPAATPQSDGSYQPLSAGACWDVFAEVGQASASDMWPEAYARYPERFHGDFRDRTRYYQSQVEVFMGKDPESDEDPDLDAIDCAQWLHEMDLKAAAIERQFQALTACVRTPRWNCFRGATMRRRLFIQALMDVERMPADEAVEPLKDYDSVTGRFQWDLQFEAQLHAGPRPPLAGNDD
jgi:hypothetical protein